ncbi:hypothetical protein PR003_g17672 [Phytophthora rubi]|uniref:DDE-1 domain-containing protein n=1 Tax=Phytophthora rubi TaxID=129364 RepID=A0A6A4EC27_9STRA|nr:hypothetical protein PR003_g17672 [Phytophthora rubi]
MKHNLSPTTIWRHANGLLKPGARHGKPPLLPKDEELGVVDVVRLRSRRGLCMDVDEMRYLIRQAAIACGNFPPQGFPSRRYVARFVKRHAKVLCIKHAQVLDITRNEGSKEDRIRSYYNNLEKEIDGLPRDRVWNCDETGFSPRGLSAPRVVCEKGLPSNAVKSADRENVSVMACIAADGSALDPMFIFSGVRIKLEWMTGASVTAVCAATESSNSNNQLFLHWLKYFDKCLSQRGTERPVIWVLDGHFSHLNYKALAFAVSVKIEIFTLPSHTSHFMQPLDTLVFRALKKGYEELVKTIPLRHAGARPTKDGVVSLVTIVWKAAMIPENVMGSFRCKGIFPLSVDNML